MMFATLVSCILGTKKILTLEKSIAFLSTKVATHTGPGSTTDVFDKGLLVLKHCWNSKATVSTSASSSWSQLRAMLGECWCCGCRTGAGCHEITVNLLTLCKCVVWAGRPVPSSGCHIPSEVYWWSCEGRQAGIGCSGIRCRKKSAVLCLMTCLSALHCAQDAHKWVWPDGSGAR